MSLAVFRAIRLVIALAFALCFTRLATAQDLPSMPDPATTESCNAFKAAVVAAYTQADSEYRACYNNPGTCGTAPARRGAAGVRMADIPLCFSRAARASLEKLRDYATRQFMETQQPLATKVKDATDRAREGADLLKSVADYKKSSDEKKIELHRDFAIKINNKINKDDVTQKIAAESFKMVADSQKFALAELDKSLKEIVGFHKELTSRSNTVKRLDQSIARASRKAVSSDQWLSDAEAMEETERRAFEQATERFQAHLARLQEQAAQAQRDQEAADEEAAEAQAQQNAAAQALLGGFLQGMAGAMNSRSSGSYGGGGGGSFSTAPGSGSRAGLRCRPGESEARCVHR